MKKVTLFLFAASLLPSCVLAWMRRFTKSAKASHKKREKKTKHHRIKNRTH